MARPIIWATILSCAIILYYHIRRRGVGSFHAGWMGVLLLAPCWFRVSPGDLLQLDVRSAAALVILLALVLEPSPGGMRFRFVLSDLLVGMCFLEQVVSHFAGGEVTPTIPYNVMRDWLLPYVIGRLFIRGWWDLDRALPGICIAATALAVLTILEGLSHIHLWYKLLGNYETIWFADDAIRWGLRRPVGPQTHSIYLGLTLSMMVPWLLEAYRRSLAGRGPTWWRTALWVLLIGIFCSTSRGAQISACCVLAVDLFFRKVSWRPALSVLAVAAAICTVVMREEIVDVLSLYAGESKSEGLPILIDGVEYLYSGTHHRELLSIAYHEASEKAGLLGFGNPGKVPKPADLDSRLLSVDDHYLMWKLQYGDLGLVGFIALMLCVFYYLVMAAWPAAGPFAALAGGLVGAMIGLAVGMRSVWFAPDYGQVWLWSCGIAGSIHEVRLRVLQNGRQG